MKDEAPISLSEQLYERALKVLPGGVSRNTVLRKPHPSYAVRASGTRVVDAEGFERIDFANNMASLVHGHAHPQIVAAVTEQLSKGTAVTMATEIEIQFAEHLIGRTESFEKIRFVNSGTEAVMTAVKASRAFTGRPKIAKVEGSYHGSYDYAEVSQLSNPTNWGSVDRPTPVPVTHGTPSGALHDVVVIPFNDPERAVAILDDHRGEIACVLIDPMPHRVGLVPAEDRFLEALREWTTGDDSLLVLDEVITYRSDYRGAQSWYGVLPDLTALGKLIGGGFPAGALAGRREIMDVMNPLTSNLLFPHSGTFSANPVTMTAGLVAMQMFDHAAIVRVNNLASRAIEGINDAIQATGVAASVSGRGSMFRIHLKERAPRNYREAYSEPEETARLARLVDHMFAEGFMMINTCSATTSTVMTETEVDSFVAAVAEGFERIK